MDDSLSWQKKNYKQKYLENNGETFPTATVQQCTIDEWIYHEWDDQIDLSPRNYAHFAKLCIFEWILIRR